MSQSLPDGREGISAVHRDEVDPDRFGGNNRAEFRILRPGPITAGFETIGGGAAGAANNPGLAEGPCPSPLEPSARQVLGSNSRILTFVTRLLAAVSQGDSASTTREAKCRATSGLARK